MHYRTIGASRAVLVLALLLVTACRNATAKINSRGHWVSNNQICFLFDVSGLPTGATTYVSLQLGTGAETRDFHTYDIPNGKYQICVDLPRSDAADPHYTIYGYVGDKSKTKPYAPPTESEAHKTWAQHVRNDWDRDTLVDGQNAGQIGATPPVIPPGTTINPPEI